MDYNRSFMSLDPNTAADPERVEQIGEGLGRIAAGIATVADIRLAMGAKVVVIYPEPSYNPKLDSAILTVASGTVEAPQDPE